MTYLLLKVDDGFDLTRADLLVTFSDHREDWVVMQATQDGGRFLAAQYAGTGYRVRLSADPSVFGTTTLELLPPR